MSQDRVPLCSYVIIGRTCNKWKTHKMSEKKPCERPSKRNGISTFLTRPEEILVRDSRSEDDLRFCFQRERSRKKILPGMLKDP